VEQVTREVLENFLQELGKRTKTPTSLYLIGGSALILLGAPRETIDIDYLTDTKDRDLERAIKDLSTELQLDVEYVPLDEFIPLPSKSEERHRLMGRYGKLSLYIFDPYSIALSKLDRGFEADLEDVVFLIQRGLVSVSQLERIVKDAIPQARQFDMSPRELQSRLQAVRQAVGNH